MHLSLQNTFTQTFGYGEKTIQWFIFEPSLLYLPHFSNGAITSMKMLREKKENSQSHRLAKIIYNLENLWKNIGKNFWVDFIDPIEYIIQLYFKDNLSIAQIFSRINGKWLTYKNENGFSKLLTLTLGWHLKDAEENKTTKIYSQRTAEKSIKKTLERKDARKAEFLSWFIKNSHIYIENLDQNIFNNLVFKYEKCIYILLNIFQISKENFLTLQDLNMGNQSFADRFNELFIEYNISLHISHKDIARIFEKFKNK